MSRPSLCVVTLLASLLGSGVAIAKPADEARQLVAEATVAYNLGRFDEAVRRYEECYRLLGDPVLLFDIGQAYRLGGKPEQALHAYRSFLRTAAADAPMRGVAERHVGALSIKPLPLPAWRPPEPSRAPAVQLAQEPVSQAAPRFYGRWWFWTAAGVVLAGGAALAYALHDRREAPLVGSVEPGVVAVR